MAAESSRSVKGGAEVEELKRLKKDVSGLDGNKAKHNGSATSMGEDRREQ